MLKVLKQVIRIAFLLLIFVLVLATIPLGWMAWSHFFHAGLQVDFAGDPIDRNEILNRSTPGEIVNSEHEAENIVLVTLDTTRADHLEPYGYSKSTSPNLQKLAKKSVTFNRAYAAMPTTAPSHASILSASYPIQHRLIKNGLKMKRNILTVTEVLRSVGYQTAAFVSTNRHFNNSNVAQGFQKYNSPSRDEQIIHRNSVIETRRIDYRPGQRTANKAINWLRSRDGKKNLFLWVHLFDPHDPYVFRKEFARKTFLPDTNAVNDWANFLKDEHHFDLRLDPSLKWGKNRRFRAYRGYDAETRYMDEGVGALIDTVRDQVDGSSMIIVVGDHGEGLGNHGWWGHGKMLYNEQIRVPLLIQFPGDRHAGKSLENVVETTDILPTIVHEAAVSADALDERSIPIEGQPLQDLLSGDTSSFGYAFAQRRQYTDLPLNIFLYYKYLQWTTDPVKRELRGQFYPNYETGRKFALVGPRYKYIYSTTLRDQAFDLSDDFYEQTDLLDQRNDRIRQLGVSLRNLKEYMKLQYADDIESVSDEVRERLKALGYIN